MPASTVWGKPSRLIAVFLLAGLLPLLNASEAVSGPVPGVETISKEPVDFPTPPSVTVWGLGNEEYLVTFRWKPDGPVENPGVAGAFNNWNRADLPMDGPDAEGYYSVTARMAAGDYSYKFVAGTDGWYPDPGNPRTVSDGHGGSNSVLRLGLYATLETGKAVAGDAHVEARAFLHDQDDPLYYDPYTPEDLTIRFRTLRDDVNLVFLIVMGNGGIVDHEPMQRVASDALFDYHEAYISVRGGENIPVAYTFEITDGDLQAPHPETYGIAITGDMIARTPDWAKDAVWYQIMVDRFRDGDHTNNAEYTVGSGRIAVTYPWSGDYAAIPGKGVVDLQTLFSYDGDGNGIPDMWERLYGGDFQGVIDKLDYLRDLGVTAIYLNPVFEAIEPHKYDGRSYTHADDGYGKPGEFARSVASEDFLDPRTWEFNESDKLLLRLVAEARKRDMHVILDGVFNHLGDEAIPFLDVKENGRESRFADWYIIESWEPFQYKGWAGFGGLPEFAKDPEAGLASETLIKYIFDVTERWMDPNGDGDPSDGIDGWRLDVPFEIPKPFWVAWRDHVKSINPDAYITGEIWEPAEDWLNDGKFDAVMNYEFSRAAFRYFGNVNDRTTVTQFNDELGRLRIRYPRASTYVLQNLYDSHDTDRWLSRLRNPDRPYDGGNRVQEDGSDYDTSPPTPADIKRMKLMALFQATYVGAPMIWYGTEIGMWGADDPLCRMPMWWEDMGPYENPHYVIRGDLRECFRNLFHLRADEETLRRGEFRTLLTDDGMDVFVYLRFQREKPGRVIVALNNSDQPRNVSIPLNDGELFPSGAAGATVLHGDAAAMKSAQGGRLLLTIPAVDGLVIRLD